MAANLKLRSEDERAVLQDLLAAVATDHEAYAAVLAEWQAYHEELAGLERQVTGLLDARNGLQARQLAHWRARTAQCLMTSEEGSGHEGDRLRD